MKLPRKLKKKYKTMYMRYRIAIEGVYVDSKNIRITKKDSIGFIGEYVK